MLNKKKIYIFLGLLLLTACTTTSSYKVQSFFFDGVPNPNGQITTQSGTELIEAVNDSTILFKAANVVHPPYKEKACAECHSKEYMGRPKMEQPQLCYQCHDDFGKTNAFLHGPVESGFCTQCHQPHKATIETLLLRNGQDLCLKCHIKDKIVSNRVHTNIETKSCMACHDPHGGASSTYLNKNSCFTCHDDFTANKQFVHGPVAAGPCTTCHASHKSTSVNLLVNTGSALCLNCHNEADVFATAHHRNEKESSCVSCHNPHSSDNKYFLTLNTPKG
jgi:predicted CXXCH cytochrome family protein